jgi:hypothetical protein
MNTFKIAGLAMAGLFITSGLATAGPFNGKLVVSPVPHFPVLLACKVAGSPIEFPDTIAIINTGFITAKAGTSVHWSIPKWNSSGTYILSADLTPKHIVYFANPVGEMEAGTPCKLS